MMFMDTSSTRSRLWKGVILLLLVFMLFTEDGMKSLSGIVNIPHTAERSPSVSTAERCRTLLNILTPRPHLFFYTSLHYHPPLS